MSNKIPYHIILIFSLISLAAFSCKKQETMPAPSSGRDYFPTELGSWISYKVDSITWNDFYTPVKVDTFSFFIKMKIDSQFVDDQGRTSFVWRKYYKTDSTSWELIKNYTITKTPVRVESYEENVRFIKMAFPVNATTTWDMNAFNSAKATSSYYDDYDIPETVNSHKFDSCAVVINADTETLISKDFYKEIYAKNTGLVYRSVTSVKKEMDGTWINGFQYSYIFMASGKD